MARCIWIDSKPCAKKRDIERNGSATAAHLCVQQTHCRFIVIILCFICFLFFGSWSVYKLHIFQMLVFIFGLATRNASADLMFTEKLNEEWNKKTPRQQWNNEKPKSNRTVDFVCVFMYFFGNRVCRTCENIEFANNRKCISNARSSNRFMPIRTNGMAMPCGVQSNVE